jgi:hypothetical protein
MALTSDAVMVLLNDVADDPVDHDDWHTYEHMHERLSIPGFLRGSRWVRIEGSPRYLIIYEVESVAMAQSPDYLARLNAPTPWTSATMKQLRGMVRGFCEVTASAGYGLGRAAFALRFSASEEGRAWLRSQIQRLGSLRGIAAAHLFDPSAAPPMTREQAIRGKDATLDPMVLVTAYDPAALRQACADHFGAETLAGNAVEPIDRGFYELAFTATAAEVERTPAGPRLRGYR